MKRAETDAALRREWDAYRKLDALIRESAEPVPEIDWDGFTGTVHRKCAESLKRRRRLLSLTWLRPLAAAAAVALMLTGGYIAYLAVGPTTGTAQAWLSVPAARRQSDAAAKQVQVDVSHGLPEDEIATVPRRSTSRVLVVSLSTNTTAPEPASEEDLASLF